MPPESIRLSIPSRSRPGLLHEVILTAAPQGVTAHCSCEAASFRRGEECWHAGQARELAGLLAETPSTARRAPGDAGIPAAPQNAPHARSAPRAPISGAESVRREYLRRVEEATVAGEPRPRPTEEERAALEEVFTRYG